MLDALIVRNILIKDCSLSEEEDKSQTLALQGTGEEREEGLTSGREGGSGNLQPFKIYQLWLRATDQSLITRFKRVDEPGKEKDSPCQSLIPWCELLSSLS